MMLMTWPSWGKVLWFKIPFSVLKFCMIKMVNINCGQSTEFLREVCYA